MADALSLKPNHKAVATYYAALDAYTRQDVEHEGAVSSAFQNLLDQCGHKIGWTLIPQQSLAVKGGTIRPDGTLQDDYYMKRGFWEAKDTRDDLETEIQKKINKGYPLTNIIFEDTRHAHLYQNNEQVMVADLTDPRSLCDLLNAFFAWIEPAHKDFNKAIEEFKERVPDLACGLVEKIQEAHKSNQYFIEAFDHFLELCRRSLNPNLSVEAVDEMLVQHLLTERLIRTIFDAGDFRERNVVAREVEKVIAALTSESFSRHEFLQSLDRFYLAIESAAATITDFSEKQHFLNTVYERFFQGYSEAGKQLADLHLNYEALEPFDLEWIETEGVPLSYQVENKMKLNKDKTSLRVNDALTLAGIPAEVFDYRLGNRCALEWVIDQYRVKTDKRSGITSDPNRREDPACIVRLVGQVVRVSKETVEIISSLPKAYSAPAKKSRKKKHK
ncbi:MAG: hypothetical protein CMJ64_18740 [Planctomycetaceae bacterium]|nr:hypothetical protein [Planctomycetaceae bacterium]